MAATGGRMATVGAAAALLVGAGAGCAAEYDGADLETADPEALEFAATPEYVGQVIDASEEEAYRFSMSMSMGMGVDGFDAEVATGAADGVKQQFSMDFGALFDQVGDAAGGMPAELAEADLTMEQVIDGEAIYIRAPFYAAMSDMAGADMSGQPGTELFEVFESLGDDWGRVDLDALGDVLPAEAQQAIAGGQSASPDVFLDMLRSTGEVEDLGSDEIDGVAVHGLAADVGFSDMLESQGVDADTFEESLGSDAPPGAAEILDSFVMPLEVWVDDDNLIRRISFTIGGEQMTDLADEMAQETGEAISEDEAGVVSNFRIGMTMDFTDYGDDSISIEAPEGAVDITDEFVAVYDELYGG